jgi:hypothetical protein
MIPLNGQDYIKMVQKQRNSMPDWHTGSAIHEATFKEAANLPSMSSSKQLAPHTLPSLSWVRQRLQSANEVRRSFETGKSILRTPLSNSSKEIYVKWHQEHLDNPIPAIRALSQPVVLKLLEFHNEWIQQLIDSEIIQDRDKKLLSLVFDLFHPSYNGPISYFVNVKY